MFERHRVVAARATDLEELWAGRYAGALTALAATSVPAGPLCGTGPLQDHARRGNSGGAVRTTGYSGPGGSVTLGCQWLSVKVWMLPPGR